MDFDRVEVKVMIVEALCRGEEMINKNNLVTEILVKAGFTLIHENKCRDNFYVHKSYLPVVQRMQRTLQHE